MMPNSPRTLAVIALVAVAVAHPLCAHSLVLCVGSDGHLELEASVDGSCADAPASAERVIPVDSASMDHGAEDHCGECVDLPMVHASPDILSLSYSVRVIPPSAVALFPLTMQAAPPGAVHADPIPAGASSATFLAALRSVSLLI